MTEHVPAQPAPEETPAPSPAPAHNASTDDLMAAVFDKHVNGDGTIKGEGTEGKEAATDAAPEPEGEQRANDDAPVSEGDEEAGKAADADGAGDAKAAPDDAPAPPAHLPKEIKESWSDIPENIQKVIDRREREFGAKFSELGREIEKVRPISERLNGMIEQYPALRDKTPEELAQGAAELAAVQMELDKNPFETVLRIAQQYNVMPQLQQAFTGQSPTKEQATIHQMQSHIANLERRLQNSDGKQPNINEAVDSRLQEHQAERAVSDFASNAEHFDAVENDLPAFIEIVRSRNPSATMDELLREGYDMAVTALGIGGATALNGGEKDTAKAASNQKPPEEPENSKRTVKAIKAAQLNVKSSASTQRPPKTQDQEMAAVWDKHMA